jgi:hypothetical protein
MMLDLENLIKTVWIKVKKRHLFPELPAPRFIEGEERVGLDIKAKKIALSRAFVEKMSVALNPHQVVEGLLDHAVSHYRFCPWNLSSHLKLYKEAKQVLRDKEMARRATDAFMDVVANTHCVSQMDTPLPKIYGQLDSSRFEEAILALYQRLWDMDLGIEGHEEISGKLSRLPYLDRSRWTKSIRRFAMLLQPVLETEKQNCALTDSCPLGCHGIQQYTSQEIEQGLREVAADAGSPSEFGDAIKDFQDEIQDALLPGDRGMGLGRGMTTDADILYYMKLAENFSLPIRKVPMKRSGAMYPHHHVSWEVGRPYQHIDPWTSFGKIMPGITQTWQYLEGEIFQQEERTPDCLIVIDSSGSMQNPRHGLSYAVLGAACACDTYLRNEAEVAVYNFSDASAGGKHTLPYSRDRMTLYSSICRHLGGGTKILVEDMETIQGDRVPDIFLITDMQITNLKILIRYFSKCKNRVTAVHVGDNEQVQQFRNSMKPHKQIGIYAVDKKEDIPRIVLGRIREYLGPGSNKGSQKETFEKCSI